MSKTQTTTHTAVHDQPHVPAPNALLLALEGRAPWEFGATLASWPLLRATRKLPKGDGHSVIVFPGLSAGDISTKPLRSFLSDLGYQVQGWHQGLNFGPRHGVLQAALEQLRHAYAKSGRKVSLIGWSLGGIYARELAKLEPEMVRGVITLGTPFAGHPRSTNAWRLYELLSGNKAERYQEHGPIHEAPPVPFTSIYSRSDGIVAWPCSIQAPSEANPQIENIEVVASHFGIGLNPTAWYAIADRLSHAEGAWAPFDVKGTRKVFFKHAA
jgi:pimeloyl-ACP methyl ester carboxylesterase